LFINHAGTAKKSKGELTMDEFTQGATETGAAEPSTQTETQATETQQSNPAEGVTEQATAAPVQDRETNAAFAQMRREAEQAKRERDQAIADIYGQSHGITTWDQYQQAKAQAEAEQKAQQMGVDPRFYQEFEGVKQKLSFYEQQAQQMQHEKTLMQQDQNLSNDPNVGEFYNQYKDEVKTLANAAKCDYDIALTMLLRDKIPQLLNSTKSTAEQDAVKRLINNSQSSPGALSQGGANQTNSISSMSKSDFAKLQEQVLRGERKQI
jgi:hypothetical protein